MRYWGEQAANLNDFTNLTYSGQVNLGLPLAANWSLHVAPGYQFLRSTGVVEFAAPVGNSFYDLRTHSVTLPVMLGTKIERKVTFLVQAGPYVTLGFWGRTITEPLGRGTSTDVASGEFNNPTDYGIRGALGIRAPLTEQQHFEVWLQHDRGLLGPIFDGIGKATYQLMLGINL